MVELKVVNRELPDVQADFRKGRGTRDQIANIHCIIEKAREFLNIYFCFIDYAKDFDFVDHNKQDILGIYFCISGLKQHTFIIS